MKPTIILITITFIWTNFIFCQSFIINVNPDTISVNQGENAIFQLTATPVGGFNASIFLTLEEFQTNSVIISPSTLNTPYNNCAITVSTNNCSLGLHRLIIKGQQSSIVSFDTVYVEVNFNPLLKWHQFNNSNSGLFGNEVYDIAIDNNNDIWTCTNSGLIMYGREYWYLWGNNLYKETDFFGTPIFQENNSMINSATWGICIDTNNVKWIATEQGLVRYNDSTYNLLFPGENIWSIACYNNKVCIGTAGNGIKYFDGQNWYSYTSSNSNLPNDNIRELEMENDTIIWIGTQNGLAKFDLHFWTIYNSSNSILSNNIITSIAIDNNSSNKYLSALGTGLIKFDNSSWNEFLPPCSEIDAIYPDSSGNIWLGFQSGNTNNALVEFDGTNWVMYNSSNSGFNSDSSTPGYGRIYSIKKDNNGVLWIGTFGDGLFAYSEDSLSSIFPSQLITSTTKIISNSNELKVYPNPSTNIITIEAQFNENYGTLRIFNINGQELIKQIVKQKETQIDISKLPKGIYFIKIENDNSTKDCKIIKQ